MYKKLIVVVSLFSLAGVYAAKSTAASAKLAPNAGWAPWWDLDWVKGNSAATSGISGAPALALEVEKPGLRPSSASSNSSGSSGSSRGKKKTKTVSHKNRVHSVDFSSTEASSSTSKQARKKAFQDPLSVSRAGRSQRIHPVKHKQAVGSGKVNRVRFADYSPFTVEEADDEIDVSAMTPRVRHAATRGSNLGKVHHMDDSGAWIERSPISRLEIRADSGASSLNKLHIRAKDGALNEKKPGHRSVSRVSEEVMSERMIGTGSASIHKLKTQADVRVARAKMSAESPKHRKERELRKEQEAAALRAQNQVVLEDFFSSDDE